MRWWGLWNSVFDLLYFVGVALGLVVFAGLIWWILNPWLAMVLALLIACGVLLGILEIRKAQRSGMK